jgi:hypothetical protein
MLNRIVIAVVALLVLSRSSAKAAERDHLQHGEEELTGVIQIKYDQALRHVLARGWRKDVVVRMVDNPPFRPEWIAGIARAAHGYTAFEVTAPKSIWFELGFGSKAWKRKGKDYYRIRPILHERPLSEALSARIATLWRRVLANPRNYGNDESMYLDTDQFAYHLSFLSHERLAAYMSAWGPDSEQLIAVAGALASYANDAPERELLKAVSKAERKLGI